MSRCIAQGLGLFTALPHLRLLRLNTKGATVDCLPVLSYSMPSSQVYQLHIGPITAFSFNADGSKVAISPNSNDVDIYAKKGQAFTKTETLSDVPYPELCPLIFANNNKQHDKLVTSVDWAPQSNRIVTCSQDVPLRTLPFKL